jgi:hypothetical protein
MYPENYISGNYWWYSSGRLVSLVKHFDTEHPKYGRVWGNFEDIVFADSNEAYNHFYKCHRPKYIFRRMSL